MTTAQAIQEAVPALAEAEAELVAAAVEAAICHAKGDHKFPPLLTPEDIAERCGIHYNTVLRHIADGRLHAVAFGGKNGAPRKPYRVTPEAYEGWISSLSVSGPDVAPADPVRMESPKLASAETAVVPTGRGSGKRSSSSRTKRAASSRRRQPVQLV